MGELARKESAQATSALTNGAPDCATFTPELHCPRCGYNLRGLPQPRCPECGLQYEWAELIGAAQQQLDTPLFEYQWRHRPVRSFLRTVWLAMLPWRLWRQVPLALQARARPLLALAGLVLLLNELCWLLETYGWYWHRWWWFYRVRGVAPRGGFLAHWSYEHDLYRMASFLALGIGVWLALQIFRETIVVARVRQTHLLRVVALAWIAPVAWKALTSVLLHGLDAINMWRLRSSGTLWWPYLVADLVGLIVFVGSLSGGLSVYLKLRRGWLLALASFGMVVLLFVSSSFAVSVYYYGTSQNPWAYVTTGAWPVLADAISRLLL